jgi:hypothetical protein
MIHVGMGVCEFAAISHLGVGVHDLSGSASQRGAGVRVLYGAMHGAGRQCELIGIALVGMGESVGDTHVGAGEFVGDTRAAAGEFVGDTRAGAGLREFAGIGYGTV